MPPEAAPPGVSAKPPAVALPLADLDVDYAWNTRSQPNVVLFASETDPDSTGLEGLVRSVLEHGQDTPVDVRPTAPPFYKVTPKPYSLVAGFRRVTALQQIFAHPEIVAAAKAAGRTAIPKLPDGHVWAYVHPPLSELDAFSLNVRENTNREGLTPPDVLALVTRALQVHKLSIPQTAILLGKTHQAIRGYDKVSKLPPRVLAHWRNGGEFDGIKTAKRVALTDMVDLAASPPEGHLDGYAALLQSKAKKIDSSAFLEKAKRRAATMGALLAHLQTAGLITVGPRDGWIRYMDLLLGSGKRELRWRDANELAKRAEAAFAHALAHPVAARAELQALDEPGAGEDDA